MHDHNLDDLIIGTVPTENSKTKSFLTIVALLIVVMIVAIVLTRILLKTPDNNTLALEENMTEMIAPELKLQEAAKETEPAKEPSLSSMIEGETTPAPIENSVAKEEVPAPQDTSSPSQAVAENTQTEAQYTPAATDESTPKETEKTDTVAKDDDIREAEEGLDEAVEITDEYTQSPQDKKKPIEKKQVEEVSTPTPTKKTVEKPVAPKPVIAKPSSTHTYYIQVGSFSTDPSPRFLSSIQNSGFSYTIADGGANGAKKLLIGPYQDKASAESALANVKDRINKSAFVIKK